MSQCSRGVKAARCLGLKLGQDERSRRSHRRSAEARRRPAERGASERGAHLRRPPSNQRSGETVAGELIVIGARELVVLVLVVLFVLWVAYRLVRESRH
jgi:hypothetical protein